MMERRNVLLSLLAMAGAGSAEGGSGAWPDAVFSLKDGKTQHHPFGDNTVYFEGKTGQLKSMTAGSLLLNPGQEPHPPHQHPEEEFMVITEGTGTILVHGKESQVGPGTLMYCESNHLHGVKNTGSVPMRFYYFKWLA
jgi:mannose-6-phosphate isomerase-like protein (cupin superfamily)